MSWNPTVVRTVDLGYEQMLLLESQPRTRIKVIYGGIWLTEQDRPDDVFASSGDDVELTSHGLAVVEGLGCTRVQIEEPPNGWSLLAAWLRKARLDLTRLARRATTQWRGATDRNYTAV